MVRRKKHRELNLRLPFHDIIKVAQNSAPVPCNIRLINRRENAIWNMNVFCELWMLFATTNEQLDSRITMALNRKKTT